MKLGIVTPVVIRVPGVSAAWEQTAGITDIATIVEAADTLGYHHVTCSEHVAVPAAAERQRGAVYWDPLATFGFLAARTQRIRFATHVLVLAYNHPLAIAKRYGTLDVISGGRLILGVGVGTLREEFDLLGAPFDDRGPRADEAMQALRAALAQRTPEFHGQFYDFADFVVEPHALQPHVPLWVGGRSRASLRRAARFGDGWTPFGLRLEEYVDLLSAVDLPDEFDVVLPAERALDPLGDPDGAVGQLRRLQAARATHANLRVHSTSVAQYVDQLAALRDLATGAGLMDDTSDDDA